VELFLSLIIIIIIKEALLSSSPPATFPQGTPSGALWGGGALFALLQVTPLSRWGASA